MRAYGGSGAWVALRQDRVVPLTVMAAGQADRLRAARLTYGEAGWTAGTLPAGYHHLWRSAVIGSGAQVFTSAADALLGWQVHLRACARFTPGGAAC
jgi:hypothetical protein